ncbi:hypothetical protein [Hoylesella timonensis]|uniref:Uncharacterized protein n=1 Tax=Hoylesella timonensis CRIS 5C-B1 TaxID=679189 RepID=D1VXK0_9BACT|nr:hypothetical protein [Hoylesella timonensis]EFA98160.1 hypothetical protein HMPREF9019_0936 [Hoylesella timonensis CRIS 5C-B1]
MNTTVEVKVSVDIDDVYNELHWDEKEEFLKSHIDDLGGLGDISEQCFGDEEVAEFVEANIDKLSDEALINELKNRELEVNL